MTLTSSSDAEKHADRLRRDLAGTLDKIVDNLAPRTLAAEALAATKARTPVWLRRYYTLACSPAGLATIGTTVAIGIVSGYTVQRGRKQVRRRRRTF